jgi:hypothetical protein
MGRIAVIGDVGGHARHLREALTSLGATGENLRLPGHLTVIQVGDLVDRGPDSTGVLDLVDAYLRDQPEQWVQHVGNHEAQYLPGGTAFWRERLSEHDAGRLRRWWGEERMHVAAAVRTAGGDEVLLTHAGLTVDAWRSLGEPMTATTAALALNERPEPLIWLGDGFTTDTIFGPLWAEAGSELYEPWMSFYGQGGFVPFDQAHGHSSIVSFGDQVWRCTGRIRQRATVDWDARLVRVRIGGRCFTGVDPKHGRTGAARWQPLVLDGGEVLIGSSRVAAESP